MAFDDKKFGTLFPTRTGSATGTTNERQMLDHLGGADSFRKSYRTLPNGDTVRLETKNGMPRFITEIKPAEDSDPPIYLESGQLVWSFPGSENPTRLKPAAWRFNTISPSEDWMGQVKTGTTTFGKQEAVQPTPIDTHTLRDNIDSLAVGFPRSLDAFRDQQSESDYEAATVSKKLVCSTFPASFFSGKMRLFIQAQWGAAEKEVFDYSLGLVGTSTTLNYQPSSIQSGQEIQFGFWLHSSHGLYTADGFNYYLIHISGAETLAVYGYPIVLSSAAKRLRTRLTDGLISTPEGVRKAEAYILSDAVIDTSKRFFIGEYTPGLIGGNSGSTLAWGWKFNWNGSRASIVRITTVGDWDNNTFDGRAQELHLDITRVARQAGVEDGNWSVQGTVGGVYNWLDGWGSFNIFAPETETSTLLSLYSMAATWGTVPAYSFSGVPIYGYYDKENVWRTVTLSRDFSAAGTYHEETYSGLSISSIVDFSGFYATGSPRKNDTGYSKRRSDQAAFLEMLHITSRQTFTVSVGEWSYLGYRKNGTFERHTAAPTGSVNRVGTRLELWPDGVFGAAFPFDGEDPLADLNAQLAALPYGYATYEDYITVVQTYINNVRTKTTGSFEDFKRWAIVIPPGDCEAVHVATQDLRSETSVLYYEYYSNQIGPQEWRFIPKGSEGELLFDSPLYITVPWNWDDAFAIYSTSVAATAPSIPGHQPEIASFSRSTNGDVGTPSGSYTTLFSADVTYPYFNGNMWFRESAGGQFIGTEGYRSNETLITNGHFVGWY